MTTYDLAFNPDQPRGPDGRWVFSALEGSLYTGTIHALDPKTHETVGTIKVFSGGEHPIIDNLYVPPEHRRKGIATALVQHAKEHYWPGLKHSGYLTPDGKKFSESVDLANRDPAVRPRPRPKAKIALPPKIDSDASVRHIAALLSVSSRLQRVPSDYSNEVAGLTTILKPYGIKSRAIRMALGLTHTEGGSRRGTAHVPNARLSEHKATLAGKVREVRDSEVYFRAAYIANAAQRMQRSLNAGLSEKEALQAEAPYYRLHEAARRERLDAAAQVQRAAKMFGWPEERGTLVGWYLNPLLNNDPECIRAAGHNFYAEEGTVIGLPGSVHHNCGCYAGAPFPGAKMVNDVMANLVRFQRTRPKFKLKERRTA